MSNSQQTKLILAYLYRNFQRPYQNDNYQNRIESYIVHEGVAHTQRLFMTYLVKEPPPIFRHCLFLRKDVAICILFPNFLMDWPEPHRSHVYIIGRKDATFLPKMRLAMTKSNSNYINIWKHRRDSICQNKMIRKHTTVKNLSYVWKLLQYNLCIISLTWRFCTILLSTINKLEKHAIDNFFNALYSIKKFWVAIICIELSCKKYLHWIFCWTDPVGEVMNLHLSVSYAITPSMFDPMELLKHVVPQFW